ncbi:MAG TPA: RNA methyltransferase [Caldilineaceae bacterium]|nr:RNA methyltransferase [Caldilineaceae bacterium]
MGATPAPEPSQAGYAAIGLLNPKNPHNVGGALRAAYCFGAALVVISGSRYRVQRTDTANAYRFIPLLQVDDLHAAIPYDCVPVAIERHPAAIPLPVYVHPERAFYVFGPEDGDLGRAVTRWCRDIVAIPSAHALNLAAAVNVVLYDRLAKRQLDLSRRDKNSAG